jgi:ketosteroid isomerase-like protein
MFRSTTTTRTCIESCHGPELGAGGADRADLLMDVERFWEKVEFQSEALFGSGEHAALFGRFTYRSRVLGKLVTTPFAVFARVVNGKCTYLQFMEDTFATGASFRSGGQWNFAAIPTVVRLPSECPAFRRRRPALALQPHPEK